MKLQPLPVPTRAFDGEGLISYANRHSSRNGTSIDDVERALAQTGAMPGTSRRHAPERLQAWRELGTLHRRAFTTPPTINGADVIDRPLCLRCTNGADGYGRLPGIGWVCARHRRWIGTPQRDIRALPELIAAERQYRRVLARRGVLVRSPVLRIARECAIVGIGRSILARRSHRADTSDLTLLTYPETIRIARRITAPGFNIHMLHPGPGGRHALSLRSIADFFPEAEEDETWRAAHRITAMFNAIAREIEKYPSGAPVITRAWTIWGT